MLSMLVSVLGVIVVSVAATSEQRNVFEPDFAWGVSSAAYQTEGGWDADGKGPSIWDVFTHDKRKDNADEASDGYHMYQEDVGKHLTKINVTHYKLSISWSRVLPDGTLLSKNAAGIKFYKNFMTELIDKNIIPVVCLYHHDLPGALQGYGGWMNKTTIGMFEDYARLVFKELGDLVKLWVTMTSPWNDAYRGHGDGSFAPGMSQPETAPYIVAHNMIRAHVRAYHVYNDEFKAKQQGAVGIILNTDWYVPLLPADEEAAYRALVFTLGWFAEPIFGDGDYSEVMKTRIAVLSPSGRSRLPDFTTEEIAKNRGASDFVGITLENTWCVSDGSGDTSSTGYMNDIGVARFLQNRTTGHLRDLLLWINTKYTSGAIYVFDAGYGDCGTMYDEERIQMMNQTIAALRYAVSQGIQLHGYFAAQFLDGFDWTEGYKIKYGLYHVDFDTKERTQKASAIYYRTVIQHGGNEFGKPMFFTPEALRDRNNFLRGKFPSDFVWGVATAAFQIEGGWNEDGKAPSIWDTFARDGRLAGGVTGNVACDSYHQWRQDVQNCKRLGVTHYRFSLSWTRILPHGTLSSLNPAGVNYYNNLINEILANGIQPMVTIYHWDLPQALQNIGGFMNESIIQYFHDYATVCFELFGDRVPLWITINEPFEVAWKGYGSGIYAPGVKGHNDGAYWVGYNIIRAHARVYHTYDTRFRPRFNGKIGITFNNDWNEPLTTNYFDQDAAERNMQFHLGWFANPIFGNGDYPDIMKDYVKMKSFLEGRNVSRLPIFTEEEKSLNKGSADFFGINTYTTLYVMHWPGTGEMHVRAVADDCWERTPAEWLFVNPWGLRSILRWIRDQYNNPPVYVTENGFADDGQIDDQERVQYIKSYTNEMLKAIHLDNCDIRGYIIWALMDSVEWTWGTTNKFGLYHTNFTDPSRTRTVKTSALYYSQLIYNNGFD